MSPGSTSPPLPIALLVVLGAGALLKGASGYPVEVGYPRVVYWAAIAAEVGIAACLSWPRLRVFGLRASVALGAVGLVHALVWLPDFCGCLGGWVRMGWRGEVVLASAIGLCATTALMRHPALREEHARRAR